MPSYKIGSDIYDIPEDKNTTFLDTMKKKGYSFNKPVNTVTFKVNNDIYDIPENKVASFKGYFYEAVNLDALSKQPNKEALELQEQQEQGIDKQPLRSMYKSLGDASNRLQSQGIPTPNINVPTNLLTAEEEAKREQDKSIVENQFRKEIIEKARMDGFNDASNTAINKIPLLQSMKQTAMLWTRDFVEFEGSPRQKAVSKYDVDYNAAYMEEYIQRAKEMAGVDKQLSTKDEEGFFKGVATSFNLAWSNAPYTIQYLTAKAGYGIPIAMGFIGGVKQKQMELARRNILSGSAPYKDGGKLNPSVVYGQYDNVSDNMKLANAYLSTIIDYGSEMTSEWAKWSMLKGAGKFIPMGKFGRILSKRLTANVATRVGGYVVGT